MKAPLILLAAIALSGCVKALKDPPTLAGSDAQTNAYKARCNFVGPESQQKQEPEAAIQCARAMQLAYQAASTELAQFDRNSGLGLIGLGVGAAASAAFDRNDDVTKSLGLAAALISGTSTYLNPKGMSKTYAQAARRMGCVVTRANILQSSNGNHINSMLSMAAAADAASASTDSALQSLSKSIASVCEYSDAGMRVGGELAYGKSDAIEARQRRELVASGTTIDKVALAATVQDEALIEARKSPVTFAEIFDVLMKIDGYAQIALSDGLGDVSDPRKGAEDILAKYYKQQEQHEAMQDGATAAANKSGAAMAAKQEQDKMKAAAAASAKAGAAAKPAPAAPDYAAIAKLAADLAKAAEDAAKTAKQADQAAADLAACADAQ
jgi:hypothetical protein